jgi:hypothetical protein
MKKVLSDVGRLAEERPAQSGGSGYLAERPSTLPGLYRVWSPCGCCWTFMSQAASVLTQCEQAEHDFVWAEAEAALAALIRAEAEEGGQNVEPVKLAIVPVPKA